MKERISFKGCWKKQVLTFQVFNFSSHVSSLINPDIVDVISVS